MILKLPILRSQEIRNPHLNHLTSRRLPKNIPNLLAPQDLSRRHDLAVADGMDDVDLDLRDRRVEVPHDGVHAVAVRRLAGRGGVVEEVGVGQFVDEVEIAVLLDLDDEAAHASYHGCGG